MSALALSGSAPQRSGEPSAEWLRAARRARALSWLSLAWMGAEGAVAITAGVLAGSIALLGFGLDSAIEGFASLVIVWRFTGHRLLSGVAEERAQKLVAIQFFLLAPYVALEAIRDLAGAARPEPSTLGMILTATSLVGMPLLGLAKQRLAQTLGSSATRGEGAQNLLCAYLAGAVFLGLLGNALLGWWWLDPVAALAIAGLAVKEGLQDLGRRGLLRAGQSLGARLGPDRPAPVRAAAARRPERGGRRATRATPTASAPTPIAAGSGLALALLLAFMATEVAVGIAVNSLALLSDAAHMLTDAGAIALALLAIRLAQAAGRGVDDLRLQAGRDPLRPVQRRHAAGARPADRLRGRCGG